jgi:hypothetical protein
MGRKDFSSIGIKRDNILPDITQANSKPKKRGRPPKNDKELESESITIKITPSELEALRARSDDLIPISTLIKHYLRTKTNLFDNPKSKENSRTNEIA